MRILPRPTWVLSVIAFLVFATILVVDGTVRGGVGVPSSKPASSGPVQQVPFVVTHGQQVVEARTSPVQTFALKKGTVALTFDGGPQPERTAELLAVLDHFHVPATFFIDGSVAVPAPRTRCGRSRPAAPSWASARSTRSTWRRPRRPGCSGRPR